MKKIFTILFFGVMFIASQRAMAQFPTIFAYKSGVSGSWATAANWETYAGNSTNTPGAPGTGSTTASIPSGTHFVYIRNGSAVSMAATGRNCQGVTIETGASLIAGGTATLKVGAGNTTTFAGPNSYNVTNNGTLGTTGDIITIEVPNNAGNIVLQGTGAFYLGRLRIVGGSNPNTGVPFPISVTIDANVTFNQNANYALAASYSSVAATDNYSITINAGKTVTVSDPSGYFHSNSASSAGTYTYNINGTLDLSASTQTLNNLTAISPNDGVVNVNVGPAGLIKTGAAFNSSPTATGVANLNIASGGVVDATLATVFNFSGAAFTTNGSGILKRRVQGDGVPVTFPVKTSAGNITPVKIARDASSGTPAVYTANVQDGFDNAPADPTKCVQKQWNLAITGTPSSSDVISLSWLASDNGTNFNPFGTVTIMHFVGGVYEYKNATVTGTGTAADPYVATAAGFTSYSPFGVSNLGVVPVSLVSFTGYYNGKTTKLNWSTANETNLSSFDVEKSTDGVHFNTIGNVNANNSASGNYSFEDGSALKGTAYYRIKMVDASGRFTTSRTVTVQSSEITQVKFYPNPVTDKLTAEHAPADDKTVINIFSADGRLIMTKKPSKGDVKTSFNVSTLNRGNYTISVNDNSGKSSASFIKQ